MTWVKRILAVLGGGGALFAVGLGGVWLWANGKVDATFDQDWETHTVDFPVPFPLSDAEKAELAEARRAELGDALAPDADPLEGLDLDAIALTRAQERGKHYTEALFVCAGCHGSDFSGGTMLDEGPIGKVQGPNITRGGKTANYKPSDWDRAVRHGVLPNGKTSVMPVGDFRDLSDHELSDIIAYIDSVPKKPGTDRIREWGPMGVMLIATGTLVPDVAKVKDHHADHRVEPPPVGPTVEYGAHIATLCMGCHRDDLNGGPMPFGPPDWPPAANLTADASGTQGWTYDDFHKVVTTGVKRDGTTLKVPMAEMLPFLMRMTDDEKRALWAYIQSLPPTPIGT